MTADVERVLHAMSDALHNARGEMLVKDARFAMARAAMAATREIDAEAIKGDYMLTFPMRVYLADWLQERAKDVKETGRG